jgi:Glycosyl transferase 4-like domain
MADVNVTNPGVPSTGANGRPQVSFLAWSSVEGRSRDIAAALGGEARCYYALRVVRSPLIPIRYSFDAVRTAAYLLWRRPRAVIVTNPPIFPVLLAVVYGRLTQAPIVLDSHPAAFGRNGSRVGRLFSRFHAKVARRAVTTLVPADDLREEVESWGARADVLHEAPPLWHVAPPRPLSGRPRVLLVGILAPDEPLSEAVEAAGSVPEIDLLVTGDLRKVPERVRSLASDNVSFVGFLEGEHYRQALEEADVVLVLSDNPTAVMRSANEAVYAGRPLVVSDSELRRTLFPFAVLVGNDAVSIASGLREALERHAELVQSAPAAERLQHERWDDQIQTLTRLIARA